jgi:DNA polymerase V
MADKVIAVIDLKSFYASCECSARHLDPFTTPLVCCDPSRGKNTIVMSTTPYLKNKYGVPNVCRRRDLPNVKGMIYATPRMSYYLTISSKVVSLFLDFVAEEDLHVYSVDESFLSLGPYLNLYHASAEEMVVMIQKRITDKFGIIATAGIGPNMFLAKIALDNEGKKRPPYIAHWTYEDVPTKLWKISPITEIWGVAEGTSSRLARIGIRSLEELAKADPALLRKNFGIMGTQLKNLANGLDEADIRNKYTPISHSLSDGQSLRRRYSKEEATILLREMCDDTSRRLRKEGLLAKKVSVWLGYDAQMGAFGKERSLLTPTDDVDDLYRALEEIYAEAADLPIREVGISFGNLVASRHEQLSLFEDDKEKTERKNLAVALDAIHDVYGSNSVLRASSLLSSSTARERHGQIGGHRK